jgi:hypothetical protein
MKLKTLLLLCACFALPLASWAQCTYPGGLNVSATPSGEQASGTCAGEYKYYNVTPPSGTVSIYISSTGVDGTYQASMPGVTIEPHPLHGVSGVYMVGVEIGSSAVTFHVRGADNSGCLTDAPGNAVTAPAASAPAAPVQNDTTVCAGVAHTVTIEAPANYTTVWQYGVFPEVTGNTFTVPATTPANAQANVDVFFRANNAGDCNSETLTVVVSTFANSAITTQPESDSLTVGDDITFSVAATGSGLKYQWYKDGDTPELLTGETATTLSLTNVALADSGDYYVVVTDTCNTTKTSSSATLKVGEEPEPVARVGGNNAGFAMLYPNPASTQLTVSTRQVGTYRLSMMDATGREVLYTTFTGQTYNLNVNAMPRGMYTLRVQGQQQAQSMRIVLQ